MPNSSATVLSYCVCVRRATRVVVTTPSVGVPGSSPPPPPLPDAAPPGSATLPWQAAAPSSSAQSKTLRGARLFMNDLAPYEIRSEEHTSELQSRENL